MVAQKDLLEKWSHRINADRIEDTLAVVKKAIGAYKGFPPTVKVAFYLHGSHRHTTNIEYNTPLDVAVEITSVVGSSKDGSNPFHGKRYSYFSFKSDVVQCLENAFGAESVEEGNNTIHLLGSVNRLPVNVLVCFKYKLILRHGRDETERVGIAFYPKMSKKLVVNFPKQHQANEAIKDKGAQGHFISTVRVFKNIRKYLIEKGELDTKRVPAYFLESFISNAPSGMFTQNYVESIDNLLDFWSKNAWRNYLAIDGFRTLWGEYPQNWNIEDARYFLDILRKNWKQQAVPAAAAVGE